MRDGSQGTNDRSKPFSLSWQLLEWRRRVWRCRFE